ncbi:MAG: GMC family oxidoreductase N-terminal domain-containing protein [Bryobacteraceae bacterium]
MPLLSRDWNQRKTRYDFVIVGSGYGGAISAARLAAAGTNPKPSVCVLERGREWPVGEFPDTFPRFADEVRSNLNPLGLYDLLNYRDISVIKGSGLGGTSLVNANVAILPDEEVFKLTGWPAGLTRQVLLPYFARAKRVLAAGVHPEPKNLVKLTALQKRADQLGLPVDLLDIAVNFTIEGENEYGATQAKCTNCGDCVTGCNVGAKNTLYMNYLPMAARAGAEIYTQTKVEYVEKLAGGGWKIHGRRYKDRVSSDKFTLEARNVILAAGSINSTEILMRSEHNGLACSPRLGSNFSGNGDFFAFSYNGDHYLQMLGFGKHPESPGAATPPGPTITGAVRYNGDRPTMQRFLVEDVSFPRALFQAAQRGLPLFRGEDTDTGDEAAEEQRRFLDITQQQPYARDGALNHTMLYLVTAFDNAQGRMEFDAPFWERDGRMRVVWDNGGRQRVFQVINEELRRHARSLGSRFVENPVWSAFDLRRLVTAHPIGGCPVGEDYLHGAVDEYGRVFSGDGAVHDGLLVADGALLPSALGVNPFMTISAMAERIVERKIEELKGRPYEAPKKVSLAGIDPMDYIGSSDSQIKRLFQRTTTLPIEKLVNSGRLSIDPVTRRITNDRQWKGFFPGDLPIGQLAALLYTGYTKRFQKEGDVITGTTQSSDGMLQARNTLEEINLPESKGGLDPGRYILLHYPDPPWQGFYDLLKIINDNLLVLHVYLGEYPHGIRSFGGIMVRSYSFHQMTVEDHAEAYKEAVKPTKEQLEGVWRMDVISNANQASGLAWLRFNNKPDGRLEARYQLMGLLEGIIMPRFAQDHFRLDDFTPFYDEIKRIDDNLMIGKWVTEVPDIFTTIFPVGSVGVFHVEPSEGNRKRFGFYYLLTRATEKEMAERSLIYPLLSVQLPAGVGLKFEETMDGWYDAAAAEIPKDEQRTPGAVDCRFSLKMTVADINEFIEGVEHETRLSGSILWKGATFPIDEKESHFNLLIVNPKSKEAEIRYYLVFKDSEGRRVILDGRKYMQSDRAPGAPRGAQEILHDFTTLYANLTVDGTPSGVAYLKFRTFEDLPAIGNMIGFVMSMQVTGAAGDILVEWRARTRFLAFIGQFLQSEYDPLAPAFEETRLRTAAG